jgi:hypothetical protein
MAEHHDRMMKVARDDLETPYVEYRNIGQERPKAEDLKSDGFAPLAKMACDIFSVIPHGVGVETNYSFGQDSIGWRQGQTSGATLQQKVIVRKYAPANTRILPRPDDNLVSNPKIDQIKKKKQKEEGWELMGLAGIADHLIFQKSRRERRAKKSQTAENSKFGYIFQILERRLVQGGNHSKTMGKMPLITLLNFQRQNRKTSSRLRWSGHIGSKIFFV